MLKVNNGNPIPNPNDRKLSMLEMKSPNKNARAKNVAINAGLHGIKIAPKKKPKMKALFRGLLFVVWIFSFGINLDKSTLNIRAKLINPRIANAIGEITAITFVRDFCKIVVKINPNKIIKMIIPADIVNPNRKKVFLLSFPENLFDKKTRNPGYKGRTQTAVKGVNKPKINELKTSTVKDILTTSFYFFF